MLRHITQHPLVGLCVQFSWLGIAILLGFVLTDMLLPAATTFVRSSIVYLVAALGVIALNARILLKKPLRESPLGLRHAGRHFLAGVVISGGIMALTAGCFALCGWYHVTAVKALPLAAVLPTAMICLVNAAAQEAFDRGVFFPAMERWLGTVAAVVFDVLFFSFTHLSNSSTTWLQALSVGLSAGVLFLAAFLLTRSLWLPIGLHFGWNYFEGYVFGFSVSGMPEKDAWIEASVTGPTLLTGGSFGPEASLVTIVLGLSTASVLGWMAFKRERASSAKVPTMPTSGGAEEAA